MLVIPGISFTSLFVKKIRYTFTKIRYKKKVSAPTADGHPYAEEDANGGQLDIARLPEEVRPCHENKARDNAACALLL